MVREQRVGGNDMPIYQVKPKPSLIAKAIFRTHCHTFRGEIFDIGINGPHGLELSVHPDSPHGIIMMRVVRLNPAVVSEPNAPLPEDRVYAVGGITFPTVKEFTLALENYPCVISVSRDNPVSSQVEHRGKPDFSR